MTPQPHPLSHEKAQALIQRQIDQGGLPTSAEQRLTHHLAYCELCRLYAQQAKQLDARLGKSLPKRWSSPPPSPLPAVVSNIEQQLKRVRFFQIMSRTGQALAGIAILLFIMVSWVLSLGQVESQATAGTIIVTRSETVPTTPTAVSLSPSPLPLATHAPLIDFDCTTLSEVTVSECAALVALYHSTNGPHWRQNAGWLAVDSPCFWYGVICNAERQILRLNLANNQLSGVLPAQLGHLPQLETFDVSRNQLNGRIPATLGSLPHLTRLILAQNQFNGPIPPELGNLTQLNLLDLSDNQLSGTVPDALIRLIESTLEYANLKGNVHLSPATTCDQISQIPTAECTALAALYQAHPEAFNWPPYLNWFINETPCSWEGVACLTPGHVTGIVMSGLGLAGPLPPELAALTHLDTLILSLNNFEGAIPEAWGQLTRLQILNLSGNQLNGRIPPALGQLAALTQLDLTNNQFDGPIPPELGQLSQLGLLDLSNNALSGPLPSQLGNLHQLTYLNLYNNQLTGEIPAALGRLMNLEQLDLEYNDLTGSIPDGLCQGNLYELYFDVDQVTPPICLIPSPTVDPYP